MEIFLFLLKLDIFFFGIFRKVEDMDDCVDIGRRFEIYGEMGIGVVRKFNNVYFFFLWINFVF